MKKKKNIMNSQKDNNPYIIVQSNYEPNKSIQPQPIQHQPIQHQPLRNHFIQPQPIQYIQTIQPIQPIQPKNNTRSNKPLDLSYPTTTNKFYNLS